MHLVEKMFNDHSSYVDTAGMLYKVRNVRVCHLNKAIKAANQTEIAVRVHV